MFGPLKLLFLNTLYSCLLFLYSRKLEEEYIDLAAKIERETPLTELDELGIPICPVCNRAELTLNQDGSRSSMNVCVDCEKMTCTRCGGYQTSATTRVRVCWSVLVTWIKSTLISRRQFC